MISRDRLTSKHTDAPEWDYYLTREKLLGIVNPPVREFSIMAYTLGGRLNEIRWMKPKDISTIKTSNGEERIIVSLLTEKNPHLDRRNVPINPKAEPWYASKIMEWKERFDEDGTPFRDYSEDFYQKHLRIEIDTHPHALRHLRVHHVDDQEVPNMKPLTPRQFKDFFGWERIETSAHYQSRTRGKDLAELM